MGINYIAMAAAAKRLIGSNRAKCVLINPVGNKPVYDPVTNEYEKEIEKHDGYCIISNYEDRLVDGTVIKAGDRKIVAVLSGEPKPGLSSLEVYNKAGKLTDTYHVINSSQVNPDANTVILYRLQCRK